MRTQVVYESFFGNTEQIARKIADALRAFGTVKVAKAGAGMPDFAGVDLLVIGCPIIQWKPSAGMGAYLAKVTPAMVKGLHFASFDTRVRGPKFITGEGGLIVKAQLEEMGAVAIAEPARFYVRGKQGPLEQKEPEHAVRWALELALKMKALTGVASA